MREGRGPSRAVVAVTGTGLVIAYAVLAVVQILVLNPLAAAPGRDLAQIQRDLEAAGQSLMPAFAIGVPAFGVVLAILLAVLGRLLHASGRDLTLGYLLLLAAGTPAYFVASFGAGMSLADTYMIDGGDHSPWARPLHAASTAAIVLLVIVGVVETIRAARRSRAGDHTPGTPSPR